MLKASLSTGVAALVLFLSGHPALAAQAVDLRVSIDVLTAGDETEVTDTSHLDFGTIFLDKQNTTTAVRMDTRPQAQTTGAGTGVSLSGASRPAQIMFNQLKMPIQIGLSPGRSLTLESQTGASLQAILHASPTHLSRDGDVFVGGVVLVPKGFSGRGHFTGTVTLTAAPARMQDPSKSTVEPQMIYPQRSERRGDSESEAPSRGSVSDPMSLMPRIRD